MRKGAVEKGELVVFEERNQAVDFLAHGQWKASTPYLRAQTPCSALNRRSGVLRNSCVSKVG
jgi:hypothetical protein